MNEEELEQTITALWNALAELVEQQEQAGSCRSDPVPAFLLLKQNQPPLG
jgi:hypothetical protein